MTTAMMMTETTATVDGNMGRLTYTFSLIDDSSITVSLEAYSPYLAMVAAAKALRAGTWEVVCVGIEKA